MSAVVGLIFTVGLVGLWVYRFWRWATYLRWKWRAIPLYEQAARREKGLCEKCGYDLRGTPERCSEGGEVAGVGKLEEQGR